MKMIAIAMGLVLSSMSMASEIYKGSFQTKNLGKFDVEFHMDFIPGMKANSTFDLYQRRIDQGQWGEWVCHNSAKFSSSLKITVKVFDTKRFLGVASNEKYDQRKSVLVLSDVQTSHEQFNCDVVYLADKTSVYFTGHDSTLPVAGFDLDFKFDGSETSAVIVDRLHDKYELSEINVDELISNRRGKIQWSLNKNHGTTLNNYEWGFVDLKKVK